ncbi:MAG: tetratricopeptide repeat protein [Anaerolinea sp.]|nr:tetratricopeptide repeat protein [Anaerolinea sp.]
MNVKHRLWLWLVLLLGACMPAEVGESTAVAPTFTPMADLTATAVPPTLTLRPTMTSTLAIIPTAMFAPVCTPPACAMNEVYFCPGECSGGCGTTCVTVTPASTNNFAAAPDEWDALRVWLRDAWVNNMPINNVRAALLAAGWLRQDEDWQTADFDGDQLADWTLLLYAPTMTDRKRPANLWVVNGNGVIYQFFRDIADSEWIYLDLVAVTDLTGDGRPELVINGESCGAHTCVTGIQILSFQNGRLQNVVQAPPDWTGEAVIAVTYADIRLEDATADGLLDVFVHGGSIGSVGSGIERTYTEVWTWNGTAFALAETILDPAEYRHHLLYEANDDYLAGDLNRAAQLYAQAIHDESLITPEFSYSPAENEQAIVQFAAFRLILIALQQGDSDGAAVYLALLQQDFPDAPLSQAATTLAQDWSGVKGLAALCQRITDQLAMADHPTGGLVDMGYGNPSLTAVDVCSVQP